MKAMRKLQFKHVGYEDGYKKGLQSVNEEDYFQGDEYSNKMVEYRNNVNISKIKVINKLFSH